MEIFLTVGIAPLLDNHLFKLPASLSLSLSFSCRCLIKSKRRNLFRHFSELVRVDKIGNYLPLAAKLQLLSNVEVTYPSVYGST